jgi:hypothetical protein
MIDVEIRAARKRPRTTSASIAKLLKLRQAELDRLAALGVNAEAVTKEKQSPKQPESGQVANQIAEASLFSGLIRNESEPEPVCRVNMPEDDKQDSSVSEMSAHQEDKRLTRSEAISLVMSKTSSESQQKVRFQFVDSKGVAYGDVLTWMCTIDRNPSGKTIRHIEGSTKAHHALINPETERWVGFDGKDVPSNPELARRERISSAHAERVAHERLERELPVLKIPRFGFYDVAKIWGPRSDYGLPELERPQAGGQFDYSSGTLSRQQEQNEEIRRQFEADASARMSNPWAARGD